MSDSRYFERNEDYSVRWKKLPHWTQAGTLCFITWRTADSLPAQVRHALHYQRRKILKQFNLDPDSSWKSALKFLSPAERARLQFALLAAWDPRLDEGYGECVLRDPANAKIVADCLLRFDGDRYRITDFVVMPNHVHLMASFPNEDVMLQQCESWKRFTARQINQRLDRRGSLWQVEQFDHLVRSERQFLHYRGYIRDNPKKARLLPAEYLWYSKSRL